MAWFSVEGCMEGVGSVVIHLQLDLPSLSILFERNREWKSIRTISNGNWSGTVLSLSLLPYPYLSSSVNVSCSNCSHIRSWFLCLSYRHSVRFSTTVINQSIIFRWWNVFMEIPWPDTIALSIAAFLHSRPGMEVYGSQLSILQSINWETRSNDTSEYHEIHRCLLCPRVQRCMRKN